MTISVLVGLQSGAARDSRLILGSAMVSGDGDGLRDDQWERLQDLVPGGRAGQRGPRCDNRLFVDALLWKVWCMDGPASLNTVHFALRMATAISTHVVGCGVRGRSG